jgi:LPXTG-motif cell wall-anchored protein
MTDYLLGEEEEDRLKIRLSKAELKEEKAEGDFKMEALAELAHANKELAQFYEGNSNLEKAKEYYADAMSNYKRAKEFAVRYGSISSEHTYSQEYSELKKSFERLGKDKIIKITSKINKKATLAILTLGMGSGLIIFSEITGNAIRNVSSETTSFLGIGLIFLSLILGFFYSKKKNEN